MAVNQAPLRLFHPRWPDRASIDPNRVGLTYDRPSDTLFVDLFGEPRPAVSVLTELGRDEIDVYVRVDPRSEAVVGFQVEGVLAARARPSWLRHALSLADLRGIEPASVHDRQDPTPLHRREAIDALLDALAPVPA